MNIIHTGKNYLHFKGGKYKVIDIVKHSETLEEMVYYVDLKDNSSWVRPKEMFCGFKNINGKRIKRFELIE